MNVLITGLTGMVGSHLADYLLTLPEVEVYGFKRWRSDPRDIEHLHGRMAILEGDITVYSLQAIAYDAAANVRQYRLTLTMNLRFRDVRRNQMLFQRNGYSDRADFVVPGTVAETIVASETALQQVSAEIARSVVSFVVERF